MLVEKSDYLISMATAVDGFTLHAFVNSEVMKMLFTNNSLEHPSENTVKERILRVSREVKKTVILEIKRFTAKNIRFSAALDEWTSCSNKRFMNITLTYDGGDINLGLKHLTGSLTAPSLNSILS